MLPLLTAQEMAELPSDTESADKTAPKARSGLLPPWQPGQSGNPKGPPKGLSIARKLAKEVARRAPLDKGAKAVARHVFEDVASLQRILELIYRGKLPAFVIRLRDEAYGKPTEHLEVDRPLVQILLGDPRSLPDPLGEDPPDVVLLPPPRALPARRVEEAQVPTPSPEPAQEPPPGGPDESVYRY